MGKIKIQILWPNGGYVPIQFDNSLQCYELIDFLSFALNKDEDIFLTFNGNRLCELETLSDQGIKDESLIAVRNETNLLETIILERAKIADLKYNSMTFSRVFINDDLSYDEFTDNYFPSIVPPLTKKISNEPLPSRWIHEVKFDCEKEQSSPLSKNEVSVSNNDHTLFTDNWKW